MRKSYSRISFFVLSALLIGGFPNFMAQEAFAAAPTISSAATATTTSITLTMSEATWNESGTTGTDYVNCFRINGQTPTSGSTSLPTTASGTNTSITLVVTNAFGTGDTPDVAYDSTNCTAGNLADVATSANMVTATFTSTSDGVAPTLDSATMTDLSTVDVTFSEAILSSSVATTDFTVTNPTRTVSGVSVSGSVVTLTLDSDVGSTDTPTITIASAIDDNNAGTNTISSGSVTASNSVGKNGSGCDDCESPTLGLNSKSVRLVDDGFIYNNKPTNVEKFFTPYPLITANVGKLNTAVFKIYEDKGPENVKHFSFAFGLAKGEVIGESKAMIELDRTFDGVETVTITDPENALDNVNVSTSVGTCGPISGIECLIITIDHRFRAPLDFNIVATDVWDMQRNSWQNYYNHGIEVIGDSINAPKQYTGINEGHIFHLTETSKSTAIDEFGNNWTLDYGIWMMDYVKSPRIQDTSSVFNRMHSEFMNYKYSQADSSIEQLLEICPTCLDSHADFSEPFSYGFSSSDRIEDLDSIFEIENQKAMKLLNEHPEYYSSHTE